MDSKSYPVRPLTHAEYTAELLDKLAAFAPVTVVNKWASILWTGMFNARSLEQFPRMLRLTPDEVIEFNWHFKGGG